MSLFGDIFFETDSSIRKMKNGDDKLKIIQRNSIPTYFKKIFHIDVNFFRFRGFFEAFSQPCTKLLA